MTKHSQKEAVYAAITAFLTENNISFDNGKIVLSSDDRKTVVTMLVKAIEVGHVEMSPDALLKYDTADKLRGYSTGLLSNWLRKDIRLNGGNKHKIKSPGSRIGQDDEIIRELKAIKKLLQSPREISLVNKEIEVRIRHLQLEKNKSASFNKEAIPQHLIHLVK